MTFVGNHANAHDASVNIASYQIDVPVVIHHGFRPVLDAARLAQGRACKDLLSARTGSAIDVGSYVFGDDQVELVAGSYRQTIGRRDFTVDERVSRPPAANEPA
jgi:hypothetical protein